MTREVSDSSSPVSTAKIFQFRARSRYAVISVEQVQPETIPEAAFDAAGTTMLQSRESERTAIAEIFKRARPEATRAFGTAHTSVEAGRDKSFRLPFACTS